MAYKFSKTTYKYVELSNYCRACNVCTEANSFKVSSIDLLINSDSN